MPRILSIALTVMLISFSAMTGLCEEAGGTVLWQDTETGQLFTKPADGRVPVDAVKDLKIPESALSGLYQDDSGAIYSKPGGGRSPVAMATQAPAAMAEAPEAADYSSQAFSEAVKHVISDEEATTYPKIKLGTLFYGEYLYDFQNEVLNPDGSRGGRNKFALNRGYINLRAELTPEIKVRVTPDISRVGTTKFVTKVTTTTNPVTGAVTKVKTESATAPNSGDYEFRLKYGYVDFHNFLNVYPSLEVKLGQFEGAWLDYEENLWTYRMQGTMLVEREGFMDSANLGVNVQGKLPAGYGEWQALVDNGEGYHADETNKYKSFQARLTLTPLPDNDLLKGLNLTGFYSAGREKKVNNQNLQRDRAIAFAGYKYHDDLFAGFEYLWTHGKDRFIPQPATGASNLGGNGFSAMAWYRMPFLKPLRLMSRYDRFDHNDNAPDTTVNRYIYGLSYDIGKNVMFLVNNERTMADKGLKTGSTKEQNENLLKVDVQWKFN